MAGWLALTAVGCGATPGEENVVSRGVALAPSLTAFTSDRVPAWAADAVFYQIFPERFRNGDPANDPTRSSLEWPENVSDKWRPTAWTADWYARDEWERERGDDFYEDGVFDRRYGGDLQGVIDKLDYLQALGVNALYLNPVFYARSLHKYDGASYHHIDPHFGPDPQGDLRLIAAETSDPGTWSWTAADKLFLELVRQAHERGLRLVIDGVFNHTGCDFFAFKDLRERQADSPYKDWYLVQSYDDPGTPQNEFRYKCWWGVETLPEFADNEKGDNLHDGPLQYIRDATRRWMDPNGDGDPSDGVDGWRLDVAAEVPLGCWAELNAFWREINPDCYTVAEHWENAAEFVSQGGFSATMNYHGFAIPVKGYLIDGALAPSDAGKMLTERMRDFPLAERHALQNLIDSHDTDRVASMCVNATSDRPYLRPERYDYDIGERVSPRNWGEYHVGKPEPRHRRLQRMVVVMQAAFVGAPMIYYGDEAGMWGGDDPCDRMPMVWEDLDFAPQASDPLGRPREPDTVEFDRDLFGLYRAAIRFRNRNPVLRRGDFEVVTADDAAGVLAFRRFTENASAVVAFNRSDAEQRVRIDLPAGDHLAEAFTASGDPEAVVIEHTDEGVFVTLPPLEAAIFEHFPAG